jgi:hypothetical protein
MNSHNGNELIDLSSAVDEEAGKTASLKQDDDRWHLIQSGGSTQLARTNMWRFHKDCIYIDGRQLMLDKRYLPQTSLELGIFDIHFMYWHNRMLLREENERLPLLYLYHLALRADVERDLQDPSAEEERKTPICLWPWLWRTFCVCSHEDNGRGRFREYIRQQPGVMVMGDRVKCLPGVMSEHLRSPHDEYSDLFRITSGWRQNLSSAGFDQYLPSWLGILKDKQTDLRDGKKLWSWELDAFSELRSSNQGTNFVKHAINCKMMRHQGHPNLSRARGTISS